MQAPTILEMTYEADLLMHIPQQLVSKYQLKPGAVPT